MGIGLITNIEKPLLCKWVYRYKYVSSSDEPTYKAQLVAKGFIHEHCIDYDEIFFSRSQDGDPLTPLRSFVAIKDLELEQMDIGTTSS